MQCDAYAHTNPKTKFCKSNLIKLKVFLNIFLDFFHLLNLRIFFWGGGVRKIKKQNNSLGRNAAKTNYKFILKNPEKIFLISSGRPGNLFIPFFFLYQNRTKKNFFENI